MPKFLLTVASLSCLLGWVPASGAQSAAGEEAEPRKSFHPPTGFNGLSWGAPLSALGPIKIARAHTATDPVGKVTQLRCTENPAGCAGWVPSDQDVEGRGSFAVAEYYRETDHNPWAGSLIALQGATYLYCDEWPGSRAREDIKRHLKFCGARIFYRSSSHPAQQGVEAANHESNHTRVLRRLISDYGPPDGYRTPEGKVSIGPLADEDPQGGETSGAMPQAASSPQDGQMLIRYRWCAVREHSNALLPVCPATITLLFKEDTGWGMVLFATAAIYKFASARHASHDENNELYMALVSDSPDAPTHRNANKCLRTTGSLVCAGQLAPMTDKERQRFEP